MLILNFFDFHHNEKLWPNAEKFDPERFSPELVKNRHPISWSPFSAGPRMWLVFFHLFNSFFFLFNFFIKNFFYFKKIKYWI